MITHKENKIINHSNVKLFELVSDIKSYPYFLPWCLASRIHKSEKNFIIAELLVGFNIYREKFISHVNLNKKNFTINVNYAEGPFNHLKNKWVFKEHKDGCEIDFNVEFEFNSIIFQTAFERLFSNAVKKMVFAFEKRADKLYKNYK